MTIHRINRTAQQRRIAAYARVSTLAERQEESFRAQVKYYKQLILNTDGWELVNVYADQGISGAGARKRPGFMQMIEDASMGKIDLILCKSISRFSRNFREIQDYVHKLKAINVEVWFEKEGLRSFDPNSDLLFGTLAAVAQEESRAVSENVKWSYRRMAELGIRRLGNNRMLGFDEVDGKLVPNEDAWMVELMFKRYADGMKPCALLRLLKEQGAKRMRSKKDFTWSSVLAILKNEAYVGDRLIQKAAPQDLMTHKPDPTVAYSSKYIYNDHSPIVSRAVYRKVKARLKKESEKADRRKAKTGRETSDA